MKHLPHLFSIMDAYEEGCHLIDTQGTIVYVNENWCKMCKVSCEDAIGMHITTALKLLPDSNLEYFPADECDTTTPATKESPSLTVLKTKKMERKISGRHNPTRLLVVSSPIFDHIGELEYVFTYIRDMTELAHLKDSMEMSLEENRALRSELNNFKESSFSSHLYGESSAVQQIDALISQIVDTDATVLISGETGVGKELVANEVYRTSLRKDSPYLKINCAALPENLIESELFGYEKGAFTGANKCKAGLFEAADTGTLLLDEITELPLQLQAKLLRALQEKEITRIGGTKPIAVDVRIIAATNRNPKQAITEGTLREDLYYRLNVISITLPPLRERDEDVLLLSDFFLERYNQKYKRSLAFSPDALPILRIYQWPGNIRELENLMERLVITTRGDRITGEFIARQLNLYDSPIYHMNDEKEDECDAFYRDAMKNFETSLLKRALETNGTTYKAAEALHMPQSTFARRAKILGISNSLLD